MDFDDLIGNYVQLLEKHEDVRDELHERFQHLLIDEYQDTNRAQYALIKALAGKRGNLVAVGDEDQSIYRFRGADINNILNFERAEIKDVLSYLRLAIRPYDTPSIERVINAPSRGIGDTTTKALDEEAKRLETSLWNVIEGDLAFLPARASKAVREFREIVHD